jgi:hypothetical protein
VTRARGTAKISRDSNGTYAIDREQSAAVKNPQPERLTPPVGPAESAADRRTLAAVRALELDPGSVDAAAILSVLRAAP